MTKLLIKYQDSYICEKYRNEIDFISIPMYHPNNDIFSNLSVFITLLMSNNLSQDYSSTNKLNGIEWSNLFEEYFLPEYLHQVDKDTYIYDLNELLKDYPEYQKHYNNIVSSLIFSLTIKKFTELKNKQEEVVELSEETLYDWRYPLITVNSDLEKFISKRHQKRTNNDCLLLYSGGRDSTLAAIKLYNAGYNVHFIHFDNGHMLDQDKPYLTFLETFNKEKDYYFDYELSSVDIKDIFDEYFSEWSTNIKDQTLKSEIRCLSCRMAMYTKAIQIAKERGYKYIAEGARISQKFMLEQIPITTRLKDLASSQGIKLLLPVLYVDDDQKEIEELLANGYSSKTWESKCLIGKPPKDKSTEDERAITDYYDSVLQPAIKKKLKSLPVKK